MCCGGFADVEECDVVFFAAGAEEDDAEPASARAACAPAPVEIDFGIARGVDLDDEVYGGDVQPAGGDVRGEQDGRAHGVCESGEIFLAGVRGVFAV